MLGQISSKLQTACLPLSTGAEILPTSNYKDLESTHYSLYIHSNQKTKIKNAKLWLEGR